MSDLFRRMASDGARVTSAVSRVARKIARALVLCVLPFALAVHLIASAITGAQLQDCLEDLSSKGVLAAPAQLVPPVPPGVRNAYDLYLAASDSLRISRDEQALLLYSDQRDEAYYAVARQVIDANREYYDLVDEAARVEYCSIPIDWGTPAWNQDPARLAELRMAARLLVLRAQTAAYEGRADDALTSLGAVFRVAEHMMVQPDEFGYFGALRVQSTAVGALASILSTTEPSAPAAMALARQLAVLEHADSFTRAIRGALALSGLPLFDAIRTGQVQILDLTSQLPALQVLEAPLRLLGRLGPWFARPFVNTSERHYLRYIEGQIAAAGLPWPAARTESRRLEGELLAHSRLAYEWRGWSTQHLLGRERRIAAIGTAQIALVLAAYHAEHGIYPARLVFPKMADWRLPTDPFGGGPYHYRREGAGFVVWSIGPDVTDGNGVRGYEEFRRLPSQEREANPYGYDIVFRRP